jgi:hypothetical protein
MKVFLSVQSRRVKNLINLRRGIHVSSTADGSTLCRCHSNRDSSPLIFIAAAPWALA